MEIVAVPAEFLQTPNSEIRLDPEYCVSRFLRRTESDTTNLIPIANVLTVSWVPKTDPPTGCFMFCEIADIDLLGRITPVSIDPDYVSDTPDTEKQIMRRVKKVKKGIVGLVEGWSVLVPKTRPYKRKFALVTGDEKVFYTTDLIICKPGSLLLEYCDNDSEVASCLLWLLLKKGELGKQVESLARWGTSYPTLDLKDFEGELVNKMDLLGWVNENSAVEVATEMRDCWNESFALQSRINAALGKIG